MADEKPGLTSIEVGFKLSPQLLDMADKLEELAKDIRNGEVYSVAFVYTGRQKVYHSMSLGNDRFELAGALSFLSFRINQQIDKG